jgi:hypothetical protein
MESEDYKRGWYDGFQAGMELVKKTYEPYLEISPVIPVIPNPNYTKNTCKVCFRDMNKLDAYVCYHPNCQTKVTC